MKNRDNPFLLSITGGIAAGKSTFCTFLQENGFKVIFTDILGHAALESAGVKEQLSKVLPQAINNGLVDRNLLSKLVFGDSNKLAALNRIVHPEIIRLMTRELKVAREEFLFYEIPLLFETGLDRCFDCNLLLAADDNVRRERLQKRNGYTQEEALIRINSQMPQKAKREMADLVLDNSGSLADLKQRCREFFILLPSLPRKEKIAFYEVIK